MKCPNCGHNMSDDSDFCMNCGNKVQRFAAEPIKILKDSFRCRKCGKELQTGSVFCPNCGANQKKLNGKIVTIAVSIMIMVIIVISGICIYNISLKSPIEGVSQKIYSQGMEFLDSMESASVKKVTMEYVSKHMDEDMDDLYSGVDGVDFNIDLGKNPSDEEIYFAELIDQFWKSWVICYGHESIISDYEDSDDTSIQMVTSMYKGLVSEFKDEISEAKDVLKKADSLSDMKSAHDILENIWEGDR